LCCLPHPSTALHRKKRFTSYPSPAGMSLTKLPLGRNNSVLTSLFPPRESLVVTSRLATGNSRNFFLRCIGKLCRPLCLNKVYIFFFLAVGRTLFLLSVALLFSMAGYCSMFDDDIVGFLKIVLLPSFYYSGPSRNWY
jgi:hypothetical protein